VILLLDLLSLICH